MLSPVLRSVLMYGGLIVAVGGFLALLGLGSSKPSARVPQARVETRSLAPRKRQLIGWGAVVAVVLGLGLAWWSYRHGVEIVFVRDDGAGGKTIVKRMSREPPRVPLSKRDNGKPYDASSYANVWVVNETQANLKVINMQYGRALGWGADPTEIQPGTMVGLYGLEHIGPGDEPPRAVKVEVIGGFAYESRNWLTW